jgi:hypothetical protein
MFICITCVAVEGLPVYAETECTVCVREGHR